MSCAASQYTGWIINWISISNDRSESYQKVDVCHIFSIVTCMFQLENDVAKHQPQDELWQSMQKIPNGYKSFARWEHFIQVIPLPTNHSIKSELF